MINNTELPVIPTKRYFSIQEACDLAEIDVEQLREWQQKEGQILGKGAKTLTRLDVIKLRQVRHSISDYFARDAVDSTGNPVISADEMRNELEQMLLQINAVLAN
jgi:hypothetical protein